MSGNMADGLDFTTLAPLLVRAGVRSFRDLSTLTQNEGSQLFDEARINAESAKRLSRLLQLADHQFDVEELNHSLFDGDLEPFLADLHPSLAGSRLFRGTIRTTTELKNFGTLQ